MTDNRRIIAALAFALVYWPLVALICKGMVCWLERSLRRMEQRELAKDLSDND